MTDEAEWFLPGLSEPVRQGDLLVSRERASGNIEELCLVITADCDISKGKFGKQLIALRVIALTDYYRTVWVEKKNNKMQHEEREKIRAQLAKWHSKRLGEQSALTVDASCAWVRREEPTKIADQLFVPEPDRNKFIASLNRYKHAIKDYEAHLPSGVFRAYVAFRAKALGKNNEDIANELMRQAHQEALPEDAFLLPEVPQLNKGPAVVMLREMVGVHYEAVCFRAQDALDPSIFLRIGRLKPTFKYAVSQAFGGLYSRIGLPGEYENRCRIALEELSQRQWVHDA